MKNVLKKLAGISMLITLISGTTGCGVASTTKVSSTNTPSTDKYQSLKVGVGQATIKLPSSYFPEDGFTGIHDALYSKTLLLDNGGTKIALIDLDSTALGANQLSDKKEIISRIAGVKTSNIIICVSHTFSATESLPDFAIKDPAEKVKNNTMKQAVTNCITKSVEAAMKNIQLAKVGYGTGSTNVNINRDVLTADGYSLGRNEQGTSDKAVDVIKFESLKGNSIAILSNYAVQSSVTTGAVTGSGGQLMSADLGGAASNYVEHQANNGTIAMFTCGAAGDQAPIFTSTYIMDTNGKASTVDLLHDNAFDLLSLLGNRLGGEIVSISKSIKSTQTNIPIRIVRSSVKCQGQARAASPTIASQPTKQYIYKTTADVECPIEIIQIGDIYIVGVPTELSAQLGLNIKKASPLKNTIVMTMSDGAQKYMTDSKSYDNFTYEAKNSAFAKGSAEKIEAKIQSMLNQLKQK